MQLRRLHPGGEAVTPEDAVADLDFGARAHDDRPYVVVNFVASLDGRATLEGRSAGLSNSADRRLFHLLRASVDAVFAGTQTLATERYGRIVRDPELRELRVAAGLEPDPTALVVTRSGRVPWDIPLFAAPEQRVLLFGPESLEPPSTAAAVEFRPVPTDRALSHALSAARRSFGVRSVLCEGGPHVFASLLAEGLVDELFLAVSPTLAGGGGAPSITAGEALPEPLDMELVTVFEAEGALFLRYRTRFLSPRTQP